jgi:hypothetical protein
MTITAQHQHELTIDFTLLGANVTIFSRNQFHLDQTAACMRQVAAKPDQEIRAVSVDLADAKQVSQIHGQRSGFFCCSFSVLFGTTVSQAICFLMPSVP